MSDRSDELERALATCQRALISLLRKLGDGEERADLQYWCRVAADEIERLSRDAAEVGRVRSAILDLKVVRRTGPFDCREMWDAVNKVTEMVK